MVSACGFCQRMGRGNTIGRSKENRWDETQGKGSMVKEKMRQWEEKSSYTIINGNYYSLVLYQSLWPSPSTQIWPSVAEIHPLYLSFKSKNINGRENDWWFVDRFSYVLCQMEDISLCIDCIWKSTFNP